MDQLTKQQSYIIAQVMLDLNYSATEIAKELGISRATVYRYGEKPVPEELRQFATEIKTLFAIKQQQLLAKIIKNIEEMVDKTDDIRTLIVAFEVIKKHTPSLYEIHKEKEHQEKWDLI